MGTVSGKSAAKREKLWNPAEPAAFYAGVCHIRPLCAGFADGRYIGKFQEELLDGIDGFHMHTLCEQGADALEETFQAAERQFGKYFKQAKWLNLGGGHHITKDGYDVERLIQLVRYIRETYDMEVY